jgi:hypothetical protein
MALPTLGEEDVVRGEDYCTAARIEGFEAAVAGRESACEAGARAELMIRQGAYALAHRELSRSLEGWDLPIGHLLMAKVEANLGRSREALTQVWLAARHGGRGLDLEELRLLVLMEGYLLAHELGQVSVTLERGETLELEGLFAAVGPTRHELLLKPGPARLAIRVGGVETRSVVVEVRPGRRHALERDGRVMETEREPGETPGLAASQVGTAVELRALVAAHEKGDGHAGPVGRAGAEAEPERCQGLSRVERGLCLGLEAERRRFEARLKAIEARRGKLMRMLREVAR